MQRLLALLLTVVAGYLLSSCEHRPLSDPNNGHYLRVYIDEHLKNVTYGFYDESRERPEYVRPTVLRVVLADPDTDEIVAERFLQSSGEDERGYYIDGHIAVPEGRYNLMAYNFGTPNTLIKDEQSYRDMLAYTASISERYYQYFPASRNELQDEAIDHEPDHLFLANCQPVVVGKSTTVDTLRTAAGDHFTASSVVLSYYIQVRIRGIEWVRSAVSLLGGMAGSVLLHNRTMQASDPVYLFFDMNYTNLQRAASGDGSTATLYTTFNTFGKLPEEESPYILNFEFTKSDGSSQVERIELTPMFDDPLVVNEQWILLEQEIVIYPPEGSGGMTPGVDEWEDIVTNIPL